MPARGALILHPDDNVATTIQTAEPGDALAVRLGETSRPLTVVEAIPFGFKVALVDIAEGCEIRKYGQPIGVATRPIPAGALVHVHNMAGARGRGDERHNDAVEAAP